MKRHDYTKKEWRATTLHILRLGIFLEKAFLAGAIEAFKYRASVENFSLQEVYDEVRSWLGLPEPEVENVEFISEEK